MKNRALFFLRKKKSKKLKCPLIQFLFGAFRVNNDFHIVGQLPVLNNYLTGH